MPISEKKTIEYIRKNRNDHFTLQKIIDIHTKARKKSKEAAITPRDMKTITDTLETLADIGFLSRKKKHYLINEDFIAHAEIVSVGRNSADALMNGISVTIRKEYLSKADLGDTVSLEIYDIRKNVIFAHVRRILRRKHIFRYAVVESVKKGIVYSKLPGEDEPVITAAKSTLKLSENDMVLVNLKKSYLAGHIESEIIEKIDITDDSHDIPRISSDHLLPEQYAPGFTEEEFIASIPASEKKNRKDFTKLLTVTIDGETAKDFDDAISFEETVFGYLLHVHIADVSAYIEIGSKLDNMAMKRATSFYLGNTVIPMLPEVLSNNLCSLRQDEDRLAMTAILKYKKDGTLSDYSFTRSTIKVDKRLTYKSANAMLNSKSKDPITVMLKKLDAFTDKIKNKRIDRGRIDLTLTDSELVYHEGKFSTIIFSERLKTHSIIEECMLSANEAVAHLLKQHNVPSVFRVHEKMSIEKVTVLEKFFKSINISFRADKGILGVNLQKIVEKVRGLPQEQVINFVILKSMMQAFYGTDPEGHFGLGFTDYTHFTSPIRRYPDLIVHRTLKGYLDREKSPYTLAKLADMAEHSSKMERVAQKAERDLFKIKSTRLMKEMIGEKFDGIISGISKFGMYVILKDRPVEGMIPFKFMRDDYYTVIEDTYTVIGRRSKRKFVLGDPITVRLVKSDVVSKQIDFELFDKKSSKNRREDEPQRFRNN